MERQDIDIDIQHHMMDTLTKVMEEVTSYKQATEYNCIKFSC